MKEKGLKPGIIVYTSLIQVFFNLRKVDLAIETYEEIIKLNIKCKILIFELLFIFLVDHICFTKLINGSIFCGKIDLAYNFYEKSRNCNISLNDNLVKSLYQELKSYKQFDKAKTVLNNLEITGKKDNYIDKKKHTWD